jgi:hypothetical protein
VTTGILACIGRGQVGVTSSTPFRTSREAAELNFMQLRCIGDDLETSSGLDMIRSLHGDDFGGRLVLECRTNFTNSQWMITSPEEGIKFIPTKSEDGQDATWNSQRKRHTLYTTEALWVLTQAATILAGWTTRLHLVNLRDYSCYNVNTDDFLFLPVIVGKRSRAPPGLNCIGL